MIDFLRIRTRARASGSLALVLLLFPTFAHAQDAGLDPADSGDTAWLLTATILGLLLVLPGLALFHAGRVRASSVLSVLAQTAIIVAVVSLLWVVVGYTLAFGAVSSGWLGSGNAWMLIELGNVRNQTLVPESAYALFEMVFALLASALMVGAWVDRARLGWVVGFSALWSLIVYAPIAHWIWGGGWLASRLGTVDYAGGLVVHTSAGVSALIVALLMGRRERFSTDSVRSGASPLLTLTGMGLVWAGSLALAGGSAFAAGDDAAMALINTHVGAASSALAWITIARLRGAAASPAGFARGAMAGLAMIAPIAAWIGPGMALVLGLAAALLASSFAAFIKNSLQIDDSLGIFATHAATGGAGSVMTAVVLSPALGGTGYGAGMDFAHQLVAQVAGLGTVTAWSAIATAIAALMISMALPMRVTREAELEGLDRSAYGEALFQGD